MKRLFLLCLVAVVAHGDAFDHIRATIRKELTDQKLPSIAVAVAKDGKIVWEEGFGWANRERKIAADAHTPYSLASISKPITATALMLLVERGLIDLDKPVNTYLAEAKLVGRAGDAMGATVRRVANHTSGLPLHYQFFYEDEPYRPPSRDETIRRYGSLLTPPGERYNYSNLGYGVLDYVISRIARKPYAAFLRDQVLLPLGMTHSAVGVPSALTAAQAVRYGTDSQPIPFYDFDHPGGSAVYASAHDLVRFGMFHLKNELRDQKKVLHSSTIDEMQRPTTEVSANAGYGIGWRIDQTDVGPVVSHSGGMGGVATILLLLPKQNISVAALANARTSLPDQIATEIVRALLPNYRRRAGSPAPEGPPDKTYQGKWKGAIQTYKGEVFLALDVTTSGAIRARVGSDPEKPVEGARLQNGYLIGRLSGDIGTDDANRTKYALMLNLKLRGDVLNGGVTAQTLPAVRAGNALTYWAELRRERP
jgi:CubicO group peptidase (beta-lactamase class C family)